MVNRADSLPGLFMGNPGFCASLRFEQGCYPNGLCTGRWCACQHGRVIFQPPLVSPCQRGPELHDGTSDAASAPRGALTAATPSSRLLAYFVLWPISMSTLSLDRVRRTVTLRRGQTTLPATRRRGQARYARATVPDEQTERMRRTLLTGQSLLSSSGSRLSEVVILIRGQLSARRRRGRYWHFEAA